MGRQVGGNHREWLVSDSDSSTKVKTAAPRDIQQTKKSVKRKSVNTEPLDVSYPLPPPNRTKSTIIKSVTLNEKDVATTIEGIEDGPLLNSVLRGLIRSRSELHQTLTDPSELSQEITEINNRITHKENLLRTEEDEHQKKFKLTYKKICK